MLRARLPLLALVPAIAVGGAHAGHADTIAAPFAPPTLIKPDVPPQVSAAIVLVRAVLISAWNWRLPIGVNSW